MEKQSEKLMSTTGVAAQLRVTHQRVLELITEERLPAVKVGRSYVVRAGDVSSLSLLKVGRHLQPTDTEKRSTGRKQISNGHSTSKKRGKQ